MENKLVTILRNRQTTAIKGVYCACTANEFVLRVCMEKAKESGTPLIVEATANQVNQYGGYTGMKPQEYVNFVKKLAKQVGLAANDLIIGGDHLGPLTWVDEDEEEAMAEAKELVKQFVLAGATKIHLDTSMKLHSDDPNAKLETRVIATRGGELIKVAEEAYQSLVKTTPQAVAPCYIIGSEVPIPGGEQEDTGVVVTKAADFKDTVDIYKEVFAELGLSDVFAKVVGVVVQPGVEFGDDSIHEYDPAAAVELITALRDYPTLVFEGHSTDYQTTDGLKKMVDDGIAILKVGPALTYAYREGLFALTLVEKELFGGRKQLSDFVAVLEEMMLNEPKYWEKYYHGSEDKKKLARKYSFSDRVRYYLPIPAIEDRIEVLLDNFKDEVIPLTLLSQYLPLQYAKVRKGELENEVESLLKDFIGEYVNAYLAAIKR